MKVKPIYLGNYSSAYEGQIMWVWMDPPSGFVLAGKLLIESMRKNQDPEKVCTWLSVMWSKHEDPETHWTPDEVETFLCDQCAYQDPGLFDFIMQESFEHIFQEYKDKLTKNDEVTH